MSGSKLVLTSHLYDPSGPSVASGHNACQLMMHDMYVSQAIVSLNGKSIGKLTEPSVSQELQEGLSTPGKAVHSLRLRYSRWQPVVGKQLAEVAAINIPVEADFASKGLKAKILGRVEGQVYSGPEYSIGAEAAASVSLQQQKLAYIQKQRIKHQAQLGIIAAADSAQDVHEHSIVCGELRCQAFDC